MQYTDVYPNYESPCQGLNLEIHLGNVYSRHANSKFSFMSGYDIKIINLADSTSKVYRYRKTRSDESFFQLPDDTKLRGKREISLIDIPNILLREYLESISSSFSNSARPSSKEISKMYYERLAASAGVPLELALMTCKIPYDDDAVTILIALKSMRDKKISLAQKLTGVLAKGRRKSILEEFIGKDISEKICMTDAKKVNILINYMLA